MKKLSVILMVLVFALSACGQSYQSCVQQYAPSACTAYSYPGLPGLLVVGTLGLFIYFIPAIVGRHKKNAGAIFILNLFVGWTFVGWVIALVWGCMKD